MNQLFEENQRLRLNMGPMNRDLSALREQVTAQKQQIDTLLSQGNSLLQQDNQLKNEIKKSYPELVKLNEKKQAAIQQKAEIDASLAVMPRAEEEYKQKQKQLVHLRTEITRCNDQLAKNTRSHQELSQEVGICNKEREALEKQIRETGMEMQNQINPINILPKPNPSLAKVQPNPFLPNYRPAGKGSKRYPRRSQRRRRSQSRRRRQTLRK